MVVGAIFSAGAQFLNSGAGSGSVDFFHGFQVALMMTLMFGIVQFVWWRCKQSRRGSVLSVHTPTLWTLAAAIMVNIQPMWILVIGSWKLCCGNNSNYFPPPGEVPPGWNPDSDFSYAPWGGGLARPCPAPGGNVFWDASYCDGSKYSTFPSVWTGWLIQIFFTWGGFVCMFVGVTQATQLHIKLRKQWRTIRSGQR